MQIKTTNRDLLWNYGGLAFRMAGQFLLLPLVLKLLDEQLVGLWYVFVSVNSLISTFQSGFAPSFARNVAYCWSGARSFEKDGKSDDIGAEVDFSVLNTLIFACKQVYSTLAWIAFAFMATIGSFYVVSVSHGLPYVDYLPAWLIYSSAVFLNLFLAYYESLLRGVGDFVGINKATIYSNLIQLLATAILLLFGFGLVSCSIGFLLQGVLFRLFCRKHFYGDAIIGEGLGCLPRPDHSAVKAVRKAISTNAYRDSFVSLANYLSTTANTLLCASFVGLAESSSFSISMQLLNACSNISSVALTTNQPVLQSAYANGDIDLEKKVTSQVLGSFLIMYGIGFLGISTIVMPLITLIRDGYSPDTVVLMLLGIYMFLFRQQSICAALIANTNRIPYMWPFAISSILGIALSVILLLISNGSILGLIAGQFIVQLVYNVWKWPHAAASRLGASYSTLLLDGLKAMGRRIQYRFH